jgi:glutamate 5-kinase
MADDRDPAPAGDQLLGRVSVFANLRTLVVKLGSQVLTDATGRLDEAFLASIARQVAALRERDVRVTLVSSGAVSAGRAELGLDQKPRDLSQLQAVAAVGQRRLMDAWAAAFEPLKLKVAQVLLTRDDIDHRARFLNLRNTVTACHELGAIPIINENDTISTDELVRITFGDNDILAALVSQALRADALILLSVVDGVLDADKKTVPSFESVEEAAKHLQPAKSSLGKGGMNSKLEAARIVTGSGELLVVAHGREPDVIVRIAAGENLGTIFVPRQSSRRAGRSRWIGSARGKGTIALDAGAAKAIATGTRSLLPAGISGVDGAFARGDIVNLTDAAGTLVARGLSNYSSEEVAQIKGLKTAEVRTRLGSNAYDEVIHRDNLVLVEKPAVDERG